MSEDDLTGVESIPCHTDATIDRVPLRFRNELSHAAAHTGAPLHALGGFLWERAAA